MGQRAGVVLLLVLFSFAAHAQKTIRGFVIDSASFAPLPYVSVQIKNTYRGMTTDEKGAFHIYAAKGDSVMFSLVGYQELVFAASELEETVIIRMGIKVRLLDAVTIIGRKEKTVPALHLAPKGGQPNYMNPGAGVNLGYFSKLEKEKRKLLRIKAEQDRVKSYVMVVCSPEVRERICREFLISEDTYFQMLAEFNIANQNVSREYTSEEWISVLRGYYRESLQR